MELNSRALRYDQITENVGVLLNQAVHQRNQIADIVNRYHDVTENRIQRHNELGEHKVAFIKDNLREIHQANEAVGNILSKIHNLKSLVHYIKRVSARDKSADLEGTDKIEVDVNKLISLALAQLKLIKNEYNEHSKTINSLILELWLDREIAEVLKLYLMNTNAIASEFHKMATTLEISIAELLASHDDMGKTSDREDHLRIVARMLKYRFTTESEQYLIHELLSHKNVQNEKVFTYKNLTLGVHRYEISFYWTNIYQSLFRAMVHKYEALFEYMNDEFIVASRKVQKYTKVARKALSDDLLEDDMKDKINHAIRIFSKIGMDLQYHDIMRQKVEHISSFERIICRELDAIFNEESEQTLLYSFVIRDLVKLFASQFKKIRTDYVSATSSIQRSLYVLWTDRKLAKKLKLLLFSTSSQLKNITRLLDDIVMIHDNLIKYGMEYQIEIDEDMKMVLLNKVKKTYTMQEERDVFNEIFQTKECEEISLDISEDEDELDVLLF